jgi:hypothetical protein
MRNKGCKIDMKGVVYGKEVKQQGRLRRSFEFVATRVRVKAQ